MLKIVFFKATTFIKHKIHNFDFKSFYAYTLAYKETENPVKERVVVC